jgi:hypothetical protein
VTIFDIVPILFYVVTLGIPALIALYALIRFASRPQRS